MAAKPASGPIVVLTGAGISAESGLPTFRGAGGLWEGHRVEEVATPGAFARDPALVHRFYNERRAQLRDPAIAPNAAHLALAQLERRWPGEFLLVTQNVDDLHERAGSRQLIHLHGELMRALCRPAAGRRPGKTTWAASRSARAAASPARLRPDIVWFGEMPYRMDEVYAGAGALRPVRRDRHLGAGLPGGGLRRGGAGRRGRAHDRDQPRALGGDRGLRGAAASGRAAELVPALVEELLA